MNAIQLIRGQESLYKLYKNTYHFSKYRYLRRSCMLVLTFKIQQICRIGGPVPYTVKKNCGQPGFKTELPVVTKVAASNTCHRLMLTSECTDVHEALC